MSKRRLQAGRKLLAAALSVTLGTAAPAMAQTTRPATRPAVVAPVELGGRRVEEVRILGHTKPLSAPLMSEISRHIRTREGEKFEPATVESDYQRVFGLKRFANVEARIEPTTTGVIVIFEVTEQSTIKEIRIKGNEEIENKTLLDAINLKTGEVIDPFRIGLAKEAIVRLYRAKNYPYTHVEVDQAELNKTGILSFTVVEGPRVRVRKVHILGNKSFTEGRIKDEVKTKSWFPLFVSGEYDPDQVDQDVATVRKYYEDHGFFDVRVGRRVAVSANQKEVMVTFVIDEGRRYVVERVAFKIQGNAAVTEAALRKDLKMIEGRFYDAELVKRDIRQIVKVYSPLGYIYVPSDPNPDPDYMRIKDERYFRREAGKVELVYNIAEGKPFRLGQILVSRNAKTQDKVVLRELRVQPGQLYNSDEISRASDRIKATGLFQNVTITPIQPPNAPPEVVEGTPGEPGVRALLVEVSEGQTARFMVGAGVTSNVGLLGNIGYEQRNFDITNWPSTTSELFSNRSFSGAGQTFRMNFEPGTEMTRARVDFIEPWIFDQPYSFGASAYLSQRRRVNWDEDRIGARLSLGHRFDDIWSARVFLRGETVEVTNINKKEDRAPEVLELEGTSVLTSTGIEVKRDTTDSPILATRGTIMTAGWEHYGTLGGDFTFDKFTAGFHWYQTIYEDLLDRRTILALRTDAGYITGSDVPFFEKFYGGGIGSVRGFKYRGISPRSGINEDPIGGDFLATATLELNFPLVGDMLRGVVFTDVGTVEQDAEIGTLRASVGFGFRLTLPFFGQLPIALDFGFPITKTNQDQTQLFSFSLGVTQ